MLTVQEIKSSIRVPLYISHQCMQHNKYGTFQYYVWIAITAILSKLIIITTCMYKHCLYCSIIITKLCLADTYHTLRYRRPYITTDKPNN